MPFRRAKRRAAGALLTCAAVAVGAEITLRATYGPPHPEPLPDRFDYLYVEPRRPFFEEGDGIVRAVRKGSVAQAFPARKRAGTSRVFLVGGFVAVPFSWHERSLSLLRGDAAVELINCGMFGYDSGHDLAVVREALAYGPDLFVVFSGNNEVGRADVGDPRVFRSRRALRRSLLWRAGERLAGLAEPPVPGHGERFEGNLRRLVREARAGRARVVLCTLPANLRGAPPADREGLAVYERASEHERARRHESAREHYRMAAEFSPADRCPPSRNALIRRVAAEEGAALVDLDESFARRSPLGVTGDELMDDHCHWSMDAYPLAARELAAAIRAGLTRAKEGARAG